MDLCSQVAQPTKTPGQHAGFLLTAILITENNDSCNIFRLAFVLEAFLLSSAYLFTIKMCHWMIWISLP